MVGLQLWMKDNLDRYNEQQEEEMKIKLAGDSRHKSYRYFNVHSYYLTYQLS